MITTARHPLDDLADNPIAQGAFLMGVMGALKTAGWSLAMVEGLFDSVIPAEDFLRKESALMQKVADEATLSGLTGVNAEGAAQLPHLSSIGAFSNPSTPWYAQPFTGRAAAAMAAPTSWGDKLMTPVNKFVGAVNRGASEVASLGGLAPNSSANLLRDIADDYWNSSNVGQMADSGIGAQVAKGILSDPAAVSKLQVTNPEMFGGFNVGSPEFKVHLQEIMADPNKAKAFHDSIARAQHLGSTGAGALAIQNPDLANKGVDSAAAVQAGKMTGPEAVAGMVADPATRMINNATGMNVGQGDVSDMISGKQTPGGFIGNNWHNMLSQQIKQRMGWDVDPTTLQNWLPGVGAGLLTGMGAKALGADWSTALGLGLGGGLLGGNVYQASQNGRTFGQQANHVGGYLQNMAKQYVQPLFSPSQTPDQNAAIQQPAQPGAPGAAAPAPPAGAAAPQTNAQAPTASGAPAAATPLAPAAQTAQNTQQQAQQVGASAAAQPQPTAGAVSPAAPTTPVVPIK